VFTFEAINYWDFLCLPIGFAAPMKVSSLPGPELLDIDPIRKFSGCDGKATFE
jgi:hypothetical protein